MNRRDFLQLSAGSLFFFLQQSCSDPKRLRFPVRIHSDAKRGHFIRNIPTARPKEVFKKGIVIIGGGMAGMSAAVALKDHDIKVLELGAQLGGTSGTVNINDAQIANGAHYEVAYPAQFGQETLRFLAEELDFIQFNAINNSWDFVDSQYIISPDQESVSFLDGKSVYEPFRLSPNYGRFIELMKSYSGQLPLPTRNIAPELKASLDRQNFRTWLRDQLGEVDFMLEKLISYELKDDYGTSIEQTSALAGVSYYACRPYYDQKLPIFSPPQGNSYLIDKMKNALDPEQYACNTMVYKILDQDKDVELWCYDFAEEKSFRISCKKVIYTGKKQSLPYLFPRIGNAFQPIQYSTWAVINYQLTKEIVEDHYWQNEFPEGKSGFLGFVDNYAQKSETETPILSTYFCYDPQYRGYMLDQTQDAERLVTAGLGYLNAFYETDLNYMLQSADVTFHGHAMPSPVPGYLSHPFPKRMGNVHFAGVDTGRLPLLFEAVDSGLEAIAPLLKS